MNRRVRLGLALALALAWQAPAFAAIGVGLHVAGDHHGHSLHAAELALAAAHGHHHEVDAAGHEHPALRIASPAFPAAATIAAIIAPSVVTANASSDRLLEGAPPPRTGSPQLFYLHCALLL